jgi:hypothetical protein
MLEALLVLAFLAALAGGAVAWSLFAADALLLGGLWGVAIGFAFGIPTGFWYHVELRRVLLLHGAPPARWWLHPTRLHSAIPPDAWWRVMSWCYAGALGWLVSFAGCCVFALGAAKLLLTSG